MLEQVKVGDTVLVQNQTGKDPTRWDKTGTIVEKRENDQYLVRIHGSGRVSPRNRRFLKKIRSVMNQPEVTSSGQNLSRPSQVQDKNHREQMEVPVMNQDSINPDTDIGREIQHYTPLGRRISEQVNQTEVQQREHFIPAEFNQDQQQMTEPGGNQSHTQGQQPDQNEIVHGPRRSNRSKISSKKYDQNTYDLSEIGGPETIIIKTN